MNIDTKFAMIELTDAEAAEYTAETGCYQTVKRAAEDLSDQTSRTVELRRMSDGALVDTVSNY